MAKQFDACAQVAAYTSGRSSVSPHDCTLLQHVLWQRPEESERIADHILKRLATDEQRLQQIDYLFKGEAICLLSRIRLAHHRMSSEYQSNYLC